MTLRKTKPLEPAEKPFTIVVGLDFTDAGGLAFDQAVRVARAIPHVNLELLHVFEAGDGKKPESSRELVERLKLYADEKAAAFGGLPGVTMGVHLRSGVVAREIVQFSTDVFADLVVLGSHRAPHLRKWLVGSTAERLMSSAPCPVLVAAPTPKAVPKHEPAIEQACPDCMTARFSSHGATWWCSQHAEHAKRAHAYSYRRENPFAMHDSVVSSTGVD
jgi:nucleotide-binding universal stress UspA family protein